jgi:hypothetical protein
MKAFQRGGGREKGNVKGNNLAQGDTSGAKQDAPQNPGEEADSV